MKSAIQKTLTLITLMLSFAAHADTDGLNLEGDLMIHPDQISTFFNISTDKIKTSSSWDWANLTFTQPYKTAWSQVQAKGPFDIQFDTKNIKNQEVAFTLKWASPSISVGQFEIHDVIQRNMGGVNITLHLDGICSNMSVNLPNANWIVSGKMRYDYTAKRFLVSWKDFQFSMNDSMVPAVDLGQCQSAPGLVQKLQETVQAVTSDKMWLRDVLREGVLSWAQDTMDSLQVQLMTERTVEIREGLMGTWHPKVISNMDTGLIRIAGQFSLLQKGSQVSGGSLVTRDYSENILRAVTESGFVFPKSSMQHILAYAQQAGSLQYRVNSSNVQALKSLMANRFLQMFVWPDLLKFPTTTQFYIDLAGATSPVLGTGRMLQGGGSSYDFNMVMAAHQWAPGGAQYVPYMDFGAPLVGQLSAKIQNGQLALQITTKKLEMSTAFRPEFSAIRKVNTWLSTSLIASSLKDFVNKTPFTMAVPSWALGEGMSLQMRDVQVHDDSFRIPLEFKSH